jgi:hypothetical protein
VWTDGACVCEVDWDRSIVDDDCSVYTGLCASTCHVPTGCPRGPTARDCEQCVLHAHRDLDGSCICDDFWGEADCSWYSGECHPTCIDGCFGPLANECYGCGLHSTATGANGECVCDPDWGGDDCTLYLGPCHCNCLTCYGPTEADCVDCVERGYRDGTTGVCMCEPDWTDCGCVTYTGLCAPTCGLGGCTGPLPKDCVDCILHSYREMDGSCTCYPDWNDYNDCSTYRGECDCRCEDCFGPSNGECNGCTQNASLDGSLNCQCLPGWSGECCNVWMSTCDSNCRTCTASSLPDQTYCVECVDHAHHDAVTGVCRCDDGWTDPGCVTYIGACSYVCGSGGCTGPEAWDCVDCTAHAYRNLEGVCVCDSDYVYEYPDPNNTGDNALQLGCANYRGECSPKCASCEGPAETDCSSCQPNAYLDVDTSCQCDDGWGGYHCEHWIGACHPLCFGCFGDSEWDCVNCVPNAEMSK